MKQLLLVLYFCLAICASAQLKKPDFAYPQTVIKDADAQLAKAERDGDNRMILNALMQKTIAEAAIDTRSMGQSFNLVLQAADKMPAGAERCFATLYAAQILADMYDGNRWTFNRRNLPMWPRPENPEDWSFDMLTHVADSLAQTAWQQCPDVSSATLTFCLDVPKLTQQYFPSAGNCAMAVIRNNSLVSENLKESVTHSCFEKAQWGSYAYWWLESYGTPDFQIGNAIEQFGSLHDDNVARAALILLERASQADPDTLSKKVGYQRCKEILARAAKLSRGMWLENTITNLNNSFNAPRGNITFTNDYAIAGHPATLNLNGIANVARLKVSAITSENLTPVTSAEIQLDKSCAPLDTTVTLTLPAGSYYIAAIADGAQFNKKSPKIEVMSQTVSVIVCADSHRFVVAAADAGTGAPLSNATVTLNKGKRNDEFVTRKTDVNGQAVFPADSYKDVWVTHNGHKQNCPMNLPRVYSPYQSNGTNVVLNYNLAAYMPGDTIKFVAAATNSKGVVAAHKFEIKLSDPDGKPISDTTVIADEFGRASGAFPLDKDAPAGPYRVQCPGANWSVVQVSDFSAARYRFENVVIMPRWENTDHVRVTGRLATYSGAPVTAATVCARIGESPADSVTTGNDGRFAMQIITPDKNDVQLNLRAIMPDGEALEFSRYFDPSVRWNMHVNIPGSHDVTLPLNPQIKITDGAGQPQNTSLHWTIFHDNDSILSGICNGEPLPVDTLTPGRYQILFTPSDSTACNRWASYVTLYNSCSSVLPNKSIFWSPQSRIDNGKFTFGVSEPGAWIVFDMKPAQFFAPGYHTVEVTGNTEQLIVQSVRNGNYLSRKYYIENKPNELNIKMERFSDKSIAGESVAWQLNVTDAENQPVKAAVVANVFNSRLNSLTGYRWINPLKINTQSSELMRGYPRYYSHTSSIAFKPFKWLNTTSLQYPQWLYTRMLQRHMVRSYFKAANSTLAETADYELASAPAMNSAKLVNGIGKSEATDAVVEEDVDDTGGVSEVVDWREGTIYSALWLPDLVTDAHGNVEIPWSLPAEASQWDVRLAAWTADAVSGTRDTTFTVTRAIEASVNAPLFVRRGNTVVIPTTVINTTDRPLPVKITYSAGTSGGKTLASVSRTVNLPANASETMHLPIQADGMAFADADTLYIFVRAQSGTYSDAQRVRVPVLDGQTTITDSHIYVFPPSDRHPQVQVPKADNDAKVTLTYTPNAMWWVIEALKAADYDYRPVSAIDLTHSIYIDAVALGLMQAHPELELTFDRPQLTKRISDNVKRLAALQMPSGGIKWGPWGNDVSVYCTGELLGCAALLKEAGYFNVTGMENIVTRATRYLDNHSRAHDFAYVTYRPLFPNISNTLDGLSVINKTLQYVTGNWKNFDISRKAASVVLLRNNDSPNVAREICTSLAQFAVTEDNGTTFFPNIQGILPYASLLEAFKDDTTMADGLRQYLILNKRGNMWCNRGVNARVIQAFVSTGTPWSSGGRNSGMPVTVDLTGRKGIVNLERPDATPCYAAVTVTRTAPLTNVPASTGADIAISRRLLVQRDGKWQDADSLCVGDRVRVLITLDTKFDKSMVNLTDVFPATLQPVQQFAEYRFGDNIAYYYTKDLASVSLCIQTLYRGTHTVWYDADVRFAGTFGSGFTTSVLESAPEQTSRSAATVLNVAPRNKTAK